MTEQEKQLYIKIIELTIVQCPDVIDDAGNNIGLYGGMPKAVCGMREHLINLGLAEGTWLKSSLLVDQREARRRLENNFPYSEEQLIELMGDWLELFCAYSLTCLPTTRRPFEVAQTYQDVMNLFTTNGYATKDGTTFQWTDKIAPAMHYAILWTEDMEDIGDVSQERLNWQLDTAIRTIPKGTYRRLHRERYWLNALDHLCEAWDGDKWIAVPLNPWRKRKKHRLTYDFMFEFLKRIGWKAKPKARENRLLSMLSTVFRKKT